MKKVNDVPEFLSKLQNQVGNSVGDFDVKHTFNRPEQINQGNSINIASNANFLQKLKDAQISLTKVPNPQKLIQEPQVTEAPVPVIFVNTNQFSPAPQLKQEVVKEQPQKQQQQQFPPAQGLMFVPIPNPKETSVTKTQNTIAIFPQKQNDIVLITEKSPPSVGFDNFGFHQISAPNFGPNSNLEQVVTSQLQVGGATLEIPEQRNKNKPQFSQLFPPKTREDVQNIEKQMAKLEELEHLLENTDNLSPLTLEMVQSALISLKQKKSIAEASKSKLRKGTVTNIVNNKNVGKLGLVHKAPEEVNELRHEKSFFPDPKQISVKGNAPLLVPHPGLMDNNIK